MAFNNVGAVAVPAGDTIAYALRGDCLPGRGELKLQPIPKLDRSPLFSFVRGSNEGGGMPKNAIVSNQLTII